MGLGDRIKKYKLLHWIYNIIHYRSLSHNREAYRKYAIHKPVIASISSKNFPDKASRAWLDTGHSRDLAPTKPDFHSFPPATQEHILNWSDKEKRGYPHLACQPDTWRNTSDEPCIDPEEHGHPLLCERRDQIP